MNISSSFLEAGMAAENVGFRELKYWELMSRMGRKAAILIENTFLPV